MPGVACPGDKALVASIAMNPGRLTWGLTLALTYFLTRLPASAEVRWRILQSPHFEAITDGGEARALSRIRRLEQFRSVIATYEGESRVSQLPCRLYLFSRADELSRIRRRDRDGTRQVDGLYVGDRYENLLAVDMDHDDERGWQVTHHEFLHLLCREQGRVWPRWLEEGVAECWSTAKFGKREVRVGEPPPGYRDYLRKTGMLPVTTLWAVDSKSPTYNDNYKAGQFYAQGWLLAHFLNFGVPKEMTERAQTTLKLLNQGASSIDAFQQGLGWTPKQVDEQLTTYREQGQFTVRLLKVPTGPTTEISSRLAAPGEANAWIGRWLLAQNRTNEAEREFQAAAAVASGSYHVEMGLGMLEWRRKQNSEAESHFRRARQTATNDFEAAFFLALALFGQPQSDPTRDSGAAWQSEARALLREVTRLRPNFQPAHYQIGFTELLAGRLRQAGDALVRAVNLNNFDDQARYYLATVLRSEKHFDLAREEFRQLAEFPRSPQLAARAKAALAEMDAAPAGAKAP